MISSVVLVQRGPCADKVFLLLPHGRAESVSHGIVFQTLVSVWTCLLYLVLPSLSVNTLAVLVHVCACQHESFNPINPTQNFVKFLRR